MICKYTKSTWLILIGMIITGSLRSIVVKVAYQSGFQAPLTVTLLYLFGQSLSLVVYLLQQLQLQLKLQTKSTSTSSSSSKFTRCCCGSKPSSYYDRLTAIEENDDNNTTETTTKTEETTIIISEDDHDDDDGDGDGDEGQAIQPLRHATKTKKTKRSKLIELQILRKDSNNLINTRQQQQQHSIIVVDRPIPKGSLHGLSLNSIESTTRIQWIYYVPWYIKPLIPAIFNLLNASFRWAALVYIDASVAEMLQSGLELTLSVVAARIFRHRLIGKSRWMGILLVSFGILIVERANNSKHTSTTISDGDDDENNDNNNQLTTKRKKEEELILGLILIILQSIFSVLQDINEEIFMQVSDFPPTKMLGMEGLYGLIIGCVIYFFSPLVTQKMDYIEDTNSTYELLFKSNNTNLQLLVLIGLPILFCITGIFNIKATEVTSAMTRNVWKNLRTALVWIIALCIFYFGGNTSFGEQWINPESFIILIGLLIMSTGIIVYYWYKTTTQDSSSSSSESYQALSQQQQQQQNEEEGPSEEIELLQQQQNNKV